LQPGPDGLRTWVCVAVTRVLVTGATGYIGGRLIPALLAKGYTVRGMARGARRLAGRFPGLEVASADAFDEQSVRAALEGVDVAFYLIHSMRSNDHACAKRDREAASIFGRAAAAAKVRRI